MNSADGLCSRDLDSVIKTKMSALGIDLGGTKLSAAVVCEQRLVSETRQLPTPSGPKNIIAAILELIDHFQGEHLLGGVGIATAGIVNAVTGEVVGSTGNLPGWEGTPIKTIIEGRTMLPVHVENDANAAAYGECLAGHLEDKECIVAITLGTGIGVGIVLKGHLYRGAHWAAGECGHIRISMDNRRLCTCGLWDCWEAYASGRGLKATGEEMVAGLRTDQSQLAHTACELDTRTIVRAATNGDTVAKRAMSLWHEHICNGLVCLAHTLDPDCFLVTGGLSQVVDFPLLRELVADRTLSRVCEKLEIRPSVLGEAAGMIGAACLVLDNVVERVRH